MANPCNFLIYAMSLFDRHHNEDLIPLLIDVFYPAVSHEHIQTQLVIVGYISIIVWLNTASSGYVFTRDPEHHPTP